MKVFISMPMKGLAAEEIVKRRNQIFEYIKERLPEAELLDSIVKDVPDRGLVGDKLGMFFLSKSIEILSRADLVFFVSGYEHARGCSLERKIAEAYGKFCVDIEVH